MSYPLQAQYPTIASGSTVSSPFMIAGATQVGVIAPTLTSCQAFLQVASDTTSASFKRAFRTDGSSNWAWNVAAGGVAVSVVDVAAPFRYARLETSVAQAVATVHSLQVICKL